MPPLELNINKRKKKNNVLKGKKRKKTSSSANNNNNVQLLPVLTNLSRKEVIAQYHTLQKQLAAVDKDPSFPNEATRDARRGVLRAQLQVVGGLQGYQDASRQGEFEHGGFDTSKWVLEYLSTTNDATTINLLQDKGEVDEIEHVENVLLKVLDVGSIVHRFPSSFQISKSNQSVQLEVTSIDLHPSKDDERVIQADLIDFAASHQQQKEQQLFDVVCLCLCVNFEGCPFRRGDMLKAASKILRSDGKGLVFFTIPAPCVDNSRYLDEQRLTVVIRAVGLQVHSVRRSARLWLCVAVRMRCDDFDNVNVVQLGKRVVVRGGAKRNNFSILLRQSSDVVVKDKVSSDHDGSEDQGQGQGDDKDEGDKVKDSKGKKPNKRIGTSTQGNIVQGGVQRIGMTSNQRKRARKKAYAKTKF